MAQEGQITNQRDHLRVLASRGSLPAHLRLIRMYQGRARPMEYLFGNILVLWLALLLGTASYIPYNFCGRQFACAYLLSPLFVFALLLLALLFWVMACQRMRRFHDLDLPGWLGLLTSPTIPILLLLWLMRDTLPAFGNPFREPFDSWREIFQGYRLSILVFAGALFLLAGVIPGKRKANRYDLLN